MIVKLKTITDKNTKKYGYVMNINHANKTTTDLKLYHANDFFDVNKKIGTDTRYYKQSKNGIKDKT